MLADFFGGFILIAFTFTFTFFFSALFGSEKVLYPLKTNTVLVLTLGVVRSVDFHKQLYCMEWLQHPENGLQEKSGKFLPVSPSRQPLHMIDFSSFHNFAFEDVIMEWKPQLASFPEYHALKFLHCLFIA